MTRAGEIAGRVAEVRGRIAEAARRAGRDAASVTLVAVGKTYPLDDLLAAYAAGVTAFGENRVQEAEAKFPQLPPGCAAHLIGPIQSNKANRAAKVAAVVQTIDSEDLARRLDRAAAALGKRLGAFVQVRLGGEATKSGVEPGELRGARRRPARPPEPRPPGPHGDPAARRHPSALRRAAHARRVARTRRASPWE